MAKINIKLQTNYITKWNLRDMGNNYDKQDSANIKTATERITTCVQKSRSPIDIIKSLKTRVRDKETQGIISFGLTKAFGKINRNKLWKILYYTGLPGGFIQNLIIRRGNNYLCGK